MLNNGIILRLRCCACQFVLKVELLFSGTQFCYQILPLMIAHFFKCPEGVPGRKTLSPNNNVQDALWNISVKVVDRFVILSIYIR